RNPAAVAERDRQGRSAGARRRPTDAVAALHRRRLHGPTASRDSPRRHSGVAPARERVRVDRRRLSRMRILFVGTGNACRSALAEAIERKVAVERGLTDVEVNSAGTSAWDGAPASDGALLVGLERGLDLSQ